MEFTIQWGQVSVNSQTTVRKVLIEVGKQGG